MTKFFVNIRTLTGENPAFVEITEATFVTLASARSILATDHGLAVYYGRGGMPPLKPDEWEQIDGSEWLQYLIVPTFALVPQNPLEPDKPFELLKLDQTESY